MQFIRFEKKFYNRTEYKYVPITELQRFDYDNCSFDWKFEFKNDRICGNSEIDLTRFDLFLTDLIESTFIVEDPQDRNPEDFLSLKKG